MAGHEVVGVMKLQRNGHQEMGECSRGQKEIEMRTNSGSGTQLHKVSQSRQQSECVTTCDTVNS